MKKKEIINALQRLSEYCSLKKEKSALSLLVNVANSIDEFKVKEEKKFHLANEILKKNAFSLYSDGGCRGNPGPGAWGIVFLDTSGEVLFEESGFLDNTTNNQMELQGAIEALEVYEKYLLEYKLSEEKDVFLYSDSKYVIDGLNKWIINWKCRGWKKSDNRPPENIEQWKRLDLLKLKFPNLHLRWVKGHSGHPQNERCDELVNERIDLMLG